MEKEWNRENAVSTKPSQLLYSSGQNLMTDTSITKSYSEKQN